jgi:hypothetical protein
MQNKIKQDKSSLLSISLLYSLKRYYFLGFWVQGQYQHSAGRSVESMDDHVIHSAHAIQLSTRSSKREGSESTRHLKDGEGMGEGGCVDVQLVLRYCSTKQS